MVLRELRKWILISYILALWQKIPFLSWYWTIFQKEVIFNFVSGANFSQISTLPRGIQVLNANARKNKIITNVLKFYSSLSLLSYFLKDNKAIKKALRSLPCAILNMLKLYQHISILQAKNWYIKRYWDLLHVGKSKEKFDIMIIYILNFMVSFQRHIFPKTQ